MIGNKHIEKSFDAWLYQQEGFSIRDERLFDELNSTDDYTGTVLAWLRAAHEIGFRQGEMLGHSTGVAEAVEKILHAGNDNS